MSSALSNRIKKLESALGVEEETIIVHRVIWEDANTKGKPTHYLYQSKLYVNDESLESELTKDYPYKKGFALWEPVYAEETN